MTEICDVAPATLSAEERDDFERDGFLVVERALTSEQLRVYLDLHERVYRDERTNGTLAPCGGASNRPGAMHTFGFVTRDVAYLELIDLPTTFPKVVGILGPNVHVYHCHIDQHPPLQNRVTPIWAWHQDGGRQNVEIETEPTRPRLSVKVAYFLSDLSQPGRGNLKVLPGSHRRNRLPRRADGRDPDGAVELCVKPGSAVIFDRRLWHSRSDNYSDITRKALFVAYTYRWIRPRDDLLVDWEREPFASLDPARKKLLGWGDSAASFWGLETT